MRLIDADALSKEIEMDIEDVGLQERMIFYRINDAPTVDAVEVVRCKDCKHRHEDECPMQFEEEIDIDEGDGYHDTEYIIHDYTRDDGFCSWGERRTDD